MLCWQPIGPALIHNMSFTPVMHLLTLFVSKITFTSVRIIFPAYPTMAHWYDKMILCMRGAWLMIWMVHTLYMMDCPCIVHDVRCMDGLRVCLHGVCL